MIGPLQLWLTSSGSLLIQPTLHDPEKLFLDPDLWGLDLVVVETIPTSRELPS